MNAAVFGNGYITLFDFFEIMRDVELHFVLVLAGDLVEIISPPEVVDFLILYLLYEPGLNLLIVMVDLLVGTDLLSSV
jgi:hypothetical protein